MYYPSTALGTNDPLISGGLKIVDLVPGGPNGTLLKSCWPSNTWKTDSWGWILEVRSIFSVSCDCFIILHHKIDGNSSSQIHMPDMVWFLKV